MRLNRRKKTWFAPYFFLSLGYLFRGYLMRRDTHAHHGAPRKLSNRVFCTAENFWWVIVWGTTVLFSFPTFSQPPNAYCLSQVGQRPPPNPAPPRSQPPQLTVSAGGKTFHVVASGADTLELLDGNNVSLAKVIAKPAKFREWLRHPGDIKNLVLGKNGWLWVDSDRTDYMARLDLTTMPPTLGELISMPALTRNRCHLLAWVFGCGPTGGYGYYSPTLDRYFITGYHQTLLGLLGLSSPVSYEVEVGQVKPLSAKIDLTYHKCIYDFSNISSACQNFLEIPLLHGILFKGISDEALLYDGVTTTTLLHPAKYGATTNWSATINPITKRAFLQMTSFQDKSFLVELKPGPALSSPIFIPDDLAYKWFSVFEFPRDRHIWGVNSRTVVTEVEGTLRTVINVTGQFYIKNSAYVERASGGAIEFTVKKYNNNSEVTYIIKRVVSSEKCSSMLAYNEPIVLGDEEDIIFGK